MLPATLSDHAHETSSCSALHCITASSCSWYAEMADAYVIDQDACRLRSARALPSRRYTLHDTAWREKEPNGKCRRENATQSPDPSPMELIDSDINPVGSPPTP